MRLRDVEYLIQKEKEPVLFLYWSLYLGAPGVHRAKDMTQYTAASRIGSPCRACGGSSPRMYCAWGAAGDGGPSLLNNVGYRVFIKTTLGDAVGDTLGAALGDAVGDTLGAALGDDVGDTLGAALGDTVGATLGAALGDAVGARACNNQGRRH